MYRQYRFSLTLKFSQLPLVSKLKTFSRSAIFNRSDKENSTFDLFSGAYLLFEINMYIFIIPFHLATTLNLFTNLCWRLIVIYALL